MGQEKLQYIQEKIRLSVGVAVVFQDNEGCYYLFANKNRSKHGYPSYALVGGACKFNGRFDESLEQENDDFRFSGFSDIKEADEFFTAHQGKIDSSEDLLREIREEFGHEEINNLKEKGFCVEGKLPNTDNLQISLTKEPNVLFFDPERSGRTGTTSRRVLFLYISPLEGNNKELSNFIKNNSTSLNSFPANNYPIFIKLTPDEINRLRSGQLGEKTGESYYINIGGKMVLIASQIDKIDF